MNLQICALGRAIKYCRLGLWESPSHPPFQWLQTEEESKRDLLSNSSSAEMRKAHLGCSPVPVAAVTPFCLASYCNHACFPVSESKASWAVLLPISLLVAPSPSPRPGIS